MPVDGGGVAEAPLPADFHPTDVSKNGSEFVGYGTTAAGAESLATISILGKSLHWLIQAPDPDSQGDRISGGYWSPSGDRIAFATRDDVYVAWVNSRGIRKVAQVDGYARWPHWSPDGRALRFSVWKPKPERYGLWQIRADGTRLHQLSFPGNGLNGVCCGDWMPDGKFFIFMAEQAGHHDLWAVRQERATFWGGEPKPVRLTSGPLNYDCPLASRDGKEIFVIGEKSRGELMRFDLKAHAFVDFLGWDVGC